MKWIGVLKSGALVAAAIVVAGLFVFAWQARSDAPELAVGHPSAFLTPDAEQAEIGTAGSRTFPVVINRPAGPPVVFGTGEHGDDASISCSACHFGREPDRSNRAPADLESFHQDMTLAHGTLTCLACHNDADYDALRLADGTSIAFIDVMNLCAQCHSRQFTDYQHGAHGGMTGYWDLTKGPRTRNNCIDCHNPHAPQFPMMMPTFKPFDRFNNHAPKGQEASHE